MPKTKKIPEKKILDAVLHALEEKKAEDIRIFAVGKLVDYTDHFVFCSGTSSTHISGIADEVYNELRKNKVLVKESGDKKSGWIVLDCDDVIVHCFGKAERAFYDLEGLWEDADIIHHHY